MHRTRAFPSAPNPVARGIFCAFCGILFLALLNPSSARAAKPRAAPVQLKPTSQPQKVDSYTLTQRGDGYRVTISYPQVGNPVADAELAIWAREQAVAFTDSVRMIPMLPAVPYELAISYETVNASSRATSIVFFIGTAMGGVHPEPGMATFVYDKRDGRRLSYGDLLMNQEGLVEAFSTYCRAALAEQLGDRAVTSMLEAGTEPNMSNFDLFALSPNGIRIYFPPYQAAPYSEGYLNVSIPLGYLAAFKPQIKFWDTP